MTKEFIIDNNRKIVCKRQSAPTGFKHVAEFYIGGRMVERRQVSYYNRTWESYEYSTVINKLLEKMKFSEVEKQKITAITSGRVRADINRQSKTVGMVASLGDVFGKTPKERVAWKLRMIKAGHPTLSLPSNWNSLPVSEQEARLDNIIKMLGGK